MSRKLFLFLPVMLLSFNCCSTELINLTTAKNALIHYHESGEYENELNNVIDEAKEKFNKINFTDSSVVIFDVDETALSNYPISKSNDFGYIPEYWSRWIEEAKAPAIMPVKELYDFLIQKGSKVIFITGRKIHEHDATMKNLVSQGYSKFDTLITRRENEKQPAVEFKSSKRIELTNKGYVIAGTVGDQWNDLEGAFHGIQVKVPNFTYIVD